MKHFVAKNLTKLWRDRMGGVLVYAAISAPVVIGAAGLSVDIGLWYANKRLAQSAADSAALAGALELRRSTGNLTSITNVVNADAAMNGYSAGDGDIITIDASVSPLVAVTITRRVPGLLSQVLFTETTNVQARAAARADVNDSCIWSLNPTEAQAINVVGTADVDLGCGMIARTNHPDGIHKEGSGCLEASEYKVVGGYDDSGNSGCVLDPVPETGALPTVDPLASLPAPPIGSCSALNTNLNGAGVPDPFSIPAGTYCSNIRINTSSQVIFGPGLIVLDGAKLQINASANVTGTDVSFYSTSNASNADGVDIQGGANVTLSADPGGPLPGILFYQDRNTTADITHKFSGQANMQLDGVIYAPSTDVEFTGGSGAGSSSVMIIADTVAFKGGDSFLGDFDTSSILANGLLLLAKLVE